MIQTVEAVIDEQGRVKLPGGVRFPSGRRALVTVLEELAYQNQNVLILKYCINSF